MMPSFDFTLINGKLAPFEQAHISLTHPVFMSSFGVYESIQVDQGRPFHLNEHLQRLQHSARQINLPLPPLPVLRRWGQTLVQAGPAADYALQILVVGPAASTDEPLIIFYPKAIRTYPPEFYTEGAKAITYEGQRALPQCKSFNTLVNHLSRVEAEKAGAIEAILVHANHFYEGARSNLFVVTAGSGRLLTPPATQTLSGITRDLVISLMRVTSTPVIETEISLNTPAAEMFITSTSMHVLPITTLNGAKVGNGAVGPITRQAISLFEEYYTNYFRRDDGSAEP